MMCIRGEGREGWALSQKFRNYIDVSLTRNEYRGAEREREGDGEGERGIGGGKKKWRDCPTESSHGW